MSPPSLPAQDADQLLVKNKEAAKEQKEYKMPSIGAAFQLCSASVSFPEATLVYSVQAILFLFSDNHIIKVGRVFLGIVIGFEFKKL